MKQSLSGISIVLLDIEGTICPITFVKDTLFPYALKVLPEVLENDWDSPEFAPYKAAFPENAQKSPDTLLAHVQDLTRRDVKVAYLKNLQGYLWESGYKNSAYATPLFSDVIPALKSFTKLGKRIAIYSSGSIFAQQLLFAHVKSPSTNDDRGIINLTDMIEHPNQTGESWFDTTNAGPKTDAHSYESISRNIGADPSTVLFLSDNVEEIAAALSAGMKSVVVDRPGNAQLTESDREEFEIIDSLEKLQLE